MKREGENPEQIAWEIAQLCTGWAYVFGARGELCTPANRRARYSDSHPTIKTKCKNFDGSGSCSGCKWYPSGKRTRVFDCRGFTYWVLLQTTGKQLMGAGATSQWNNANNWTAKGTIDTLPHNQLVCLFVRKGSKMEHTGFGFRGETIECSNGVQHFTTTNKKWTHWARPSMFGEASAPEPLPVLRKGSSGSYVTLAQTKLIQQGYSCGAYGADGKFGTATDNAVRAFQADHGLTPDGIIGVKTWAALEAKPQTYRVTIDNVTPAQLEQIRAICPAAQAVSEV